MLRTGLETLVEGDSSRPAFVKLVAADRKILGDNPDAFYYACNVDVEKAYLVTGRMTNEDYFSLTVYHAPCEGKRALSRSLALALSLPILCAVHRAQ